MRRRLPLALIGAALPAAALANGVSLPETIDIAMRAGNTTELGLEANFGWISAPDGAASTEDRRLELAVSFLQLRESLARD